MKVEAQQRRRGLLLVFIATALWSLAGFYTRLVGHLDLFTLLAGRAFFGALCLGGYGVFQWRRGTLGARFGFGPLSIVLVPLSAVAISSYVGAIKMTSVADVLVIYATLPFVAAALAFCITGERASQRTLMAAGIALIGVAIMVWSGLGDGRWQGQALSLVMTVTFGLMVVLQRRDPKMSMTSVNTAAAALAAIFAWCFSPRPALSGFDIFVLFAFGLTTICIAFAMFMEGAKLIPSAEAGLVSMLDAVLGPAWVYLAFGENPGLATLIGGAFVLAAVLWRMAPELKRAAAKTNMSVLPGPL